MPCPRRVTLRCIADDLATGWGTSRGRRTAQSLQDLLARHARGSATDADVGAFLRLAPPLSRLDHPLIRAFAEREDLIETLTASSTATPAGRVAAFSAEHWRGTVLLRPAEAHATAPEDDADAALVAWLVAAHPAPEPEDTGAGARGDDPAVDAAAIEDEDLPQAGDLLMARIECATERREEWKADLHRTVRCLFAESLATGDAGPVSIAGPGGDDTPLFDVTLSLEKADAEELAQVIVVLSPLDDAADASVRVGTRTVLAAIADDAVAWTAAPLGGGGMAYAAPVQECLLPGSGSEGTPGRMTVGTFAHYAPTAGLTEATLAGAPVQALCGHWFVPMHDHESRPTCPRCADLRDALA